MRWLSSLLIILYASLAGAHAQASSPIALEFAIRRLLNETTCANPQVFLLPDSLLSKTLDEEIRHILMIEELPDLATLAGKKELSFHTRIRLRLLVEIAAVLKRHSDVMYLAEIRKNSCDTLNLVKGFDETQYQITNCRYIKSMSEGPGLAVHLAQKARQNLLQASQQFPEVVPPPLDETTELVLYKSFFVEDLRPSAKDYNDQTAAAIADEADLFSRVPNRFYPDQSYAKHKTWMDYCQFGKAKHIEGQYIMPALQKGVGAQ